MPLSKKPPRHTRNTATCCSTQGLPPSRLYRHAAAAEERRELCLKTCRTILLWRAVAYGHGQHVEAPAAELRVS